MDLEAGDNVDVLGDLASGLCGLEEGRFKLIICCSVLEHVKQPWVMAENLTKLLAQGGVLYMSVPFVWRYHAYPEDYYRFTHRGIMTLFPNLDWTEVSYSTAIQGEVLPVGEQNVMHLCDKLSIFTRRRRKWFGPKEKSLPYIMFHMLGTKPV